MLFLALVIDVGYGVLTYNTPYGCSGSPIQTSQTDQQQPLINWQVLANPCFYTIWFGIVGGSACIIILIPVPDKRQLSESEQGS
ncbi:MAG TPA: hypothetical protein VFE96_07165 [Candidatus Bathyarchaeia archaeon]|jgi:hypothetical protein|nr:hypothetical protein [Candidatus Bathyarchaeia archaeon]